MKSCVSLEEVGQSKPQVYSLHCEVPLSQVLHLCNLATLDVNLLKCPPVLCAERRLLRHRSWSAWTWSQSAGHKIAAENAPAFSARHLAQDRVRVALVALVLGVGGHAGVEGLLQSLKQFFQVRHYISATLLLMLSAIANDGMNHTFTPPSQ